jgi:hypothetical protein
MRHSISKDLYDYWNGLRGARAAPDRNDVDPSAIRHLLADSFILEIDSECRFPIRLCGTRMNALWGSEQKGVSFLDNWRRDEQRDVAAAILTVVDGATPIIGGAKARPHATSGWGGGAGSAEIDYELLLLPLRHFGKTHSRVIGSLAASNHPDWFGKAGAGPLSLTSLRMIRWPEMEGLNTTPARFAPVVPKSPPRLIVFEGGKART